VPNLGFIFGTSDFTLEAWIYPKQNLPYATIFGLSATTQGPMLTTSSGVLQWYASSVVLAHQTPLVINTWSHVAAVRAGGILRLYVNGVASNSSPTYSAAITPGNPFIIGASSVASEQFNGYIDDIRITNGIARYSANFIPPVEAFGAG